MIEARFEYGKITVRVNGVFYCTCKDWAEVNKTFKEIKEKTI